MDQFEKIRGEIITPAIEGAPSGFVSSRNPTPFAPRRFRAWANQSGSGMAPHGPGSKRHSGDRTGETGVFPGARARTAAGPRRSPRSSRPRWPDPTGTTSSDRSRTFFSLHWRGPEDRRRRALPSNPATLSRFQIDGAYSASHRGPAPEARSAMTPCTRTGKGRPPAPCNRYIRCAVYRLAFSLSFLFLPEGFVTSPAGFRKRSEGRHQRFTIAGTGHFRQRAGGGRCFSG